MTDRDLRTNPFALPDAEQPRVGHYAVGGCALYAETRGTGQPILLIGASSDDAEMFRPIAERLGGFTVVSYDRRGTLRSGREGWPCDSARHADDAAGLIGALGLARVDVFGASAGAIVAVQLALRHPRLVRRVFAYEPGYLRYSASGTALRRNGTTSVDRHLAAHPGDWSGAMGAASRGLLDDPPGLGWYGERGLALAENFVSDDIPASGELADLDALDASGVEVRFAYGSASHPAFREIAAALSRRAPDRIEGAGHVAFHTPEIIADYLRLRCA
ncbi:pimeloyl-ACP methyl ester carboxylesterase [Microterricola gilva]|uniref:Pimeloyl-ACP methyl ester carboxylesterase n=1 Tax=Microterricola gilva TaxID=393267 RepID=A0A4Q8AMH7_9MICO|nr:alpha/beta hydrolase [Microterricola gilva]RZU65203.1 pimeloyl-ACP methyl ester carboxylesterase [Microterricola gilva]